MDHSIHHHGDSEQAARILRDRQAARDARRDNAASGGATSGAARILVQVFAETTLPTDPGVYYACHPAYAGGNEQEGNPPTFVADTDTTIYVLFLNRVPAAGELAVATHVGNRWVAEKGAPPNPCGCRPCPGLLLPPQDISCEVNPWVDTGPGRTVTLAYVGGPRGNYHWVTPQEVIDELGGISLALKCDANPPVMAIAFPDSGGVGGLATLVSYTPDAFSAVFHGLFGTFSYSNVDGEVINYTVTGPPVPTAYPYCIQFRATFCGGGIIGATVTVSDDSGTVGSDTTTPLGNALINLPALTTYTITIEADGFATLTVTQAVAACVNTFELCLAADTLTLSYTQDTQVDNGSISSTPGSVTLTRAGACEWTGPVVGLSDTTGTTCAFSVAASTWNWVLACDPTSGQLKLISTGCYASDGACDFGNATTYSLSPLDIEYAGSSLVLSQYTSSDGHNVMCSLGNLAITA